jgi:hypothetical protein
MSAFRVESGTGSQEASFRVSALFFIQDPLLHDRVRRDVKTLEQSAPVEGHGETFRIATKFLDTESDLRGELRLLLVKNVPATIILVSDRLTKRDASGRVVQDPRGNASPDAIVGEIRRQFLISPHLVGMVGLHEATATHVRDIDRVASVDGLTMSVLREAILNVALGLRMKAPPPMRTSERMPATESFRVEVVQSEAQLRACFGVRHAVYGQIMRYLPDEIIEHEARIEIDRFDPRSIHFAAVRDSTNQVVGTMRLVLNYPNPRSVALGGSGPFLPYTLIAHECWCKMIARRAGPPFTNKVQAGVPAYEVFPILGSTEFRTNQKQVIDEALYGCELSRLVILPAYRGFGISRVLIKAAIAKSFQLQRKSLLLECIPKHVEMYAKYGFKRLDGAPHSRPSDLDQYAIGMRLVLTQNEVADRAKRSLSQIVQQQRDFDRLHYGPFEVEGDVTFPSTVGGGSQSDSSSYY